MWAEVIFIGGACAIFWLVVWLGKRSTAKRMQAANLHAPLLPNSTEHRLDAALREAEEGFHACRVCGFENFKRFPFCNICGARIAEHEQKQRELQEQLQKQQSYLSKRRRDRAAKASDAASLTAAADRSSASLPVATTQRQLRARRRKEWTRRLGADNALFWYRDGTNVPDADLRSTGYVVRFKEATAARVSTASVADAAVDHTDDDGMPVASEHDHAEPTPRVDNTPALVLTVNDTDDNIVDATTTTTVDNEDHVTRSTTLDDAMDGTIDAVDVSPAAASTTSASVAQLTVTERSVELADLVASSHLCVCASSAADAALLPLPLPHSTADDSGDANNATPSLQWRDVLSLAQQTFPVKYAHLVMTTASVVAPQTHGMFRLNLTRATMFNDSIESLALISAEYARLGLRINFVGEKGVDAGGLHREWFVLLSDQLVQPESGVFVCVDPTDQTFYLNAHSAHVLGADHLLHVFATGRFVGRALLEGNPLGFHLALPLLKLILGLPVSFSDLEYFDPALYKSLVWMRDNDGVDALGLTFSVTERRRKRQEQQRSGDAQEGVDSHAGATDSHANAGQAVDPTDHEAYEMVTIDLIPNGRDVDVTDANKHEYLDRKFRYTLFESVSSQLYVFLKGLYEVIPQELLMLFDAEEFDYLLCGSDEIDVDDWEKHTKYTEDLHEHRAMTWFWEIVREMPNEYRRRLLHFATGSSRVPIAGFSGLTSYDGRLCPFTLKGVTLKDDGYIWSHACFNRLDLPQHVVRTELKAVMYAAVETDMYGFTTS